MNNLNANDLIKFKEQIDKSKYPWKFDEVLFEDDIVSFFYKGYLIGVMSRKQYDQIINKG